MPQVGIRPSTLCKYECVYYTIYIIISVYSVELVFRYNFLNNSVWCDQVPYSYETYCGIQVILTSIGVIILEDNVRNHLSRQFASLRNDPIRNL